jgi:DNA-binding CsgD family transcriptional regulator
MTADDGRDDGWTLADRRSPAWQARANSRQAPRPIDTVLPVLTARETEILLTVARHGLQAAPETLFMTTQSTKNTLTRIYRKLGARGMAHAVLLWMEPRP